MKTASTQNSSVPSNPTNHYESELRAQGYSVIAGVDEAGRGPLAGPVVASAVILPEGFSVEATPWAGGIQDSKLLSAARREELYEALVEDATIGIGIEEPETIDRINILRATHSAMRKAVGELVPTPDHVLIDGHPIGDTHFPFTAIIKGDRKSLSIAAASIIAKVTRDRIMLDLDQEYPMYGFAKHKGYATREHLERLSRHGPCPAHRTSFAPVRLACLGKAESASAQFTDQMRFLVE